MKYPEALTYLLRLTAGTAFSPQQEETLPFSEVMNIIAKLSPGAQEEVLRHVAEVIATKPFTEEQSDIVLNAILKQQAHQSCTCCLGDELNKIVSMIILKQITLQPSPELVEELMKTGKGKAAFESEGYQSFLKILEESMTTNDA